MSLSKIITSYWAKPTPPREFDWSAVYDDYDGAPDSRSRNMIGYGRTEAEAVLALMDEWPRYALVECCDKETERCKVCGAYVPEGDIGPMPACRESRADCGLTDMSECTCRMSSVHSASIDPPYMIVDSWCPIHGGRDPDAEYEAQRDDAAYFRDAGWDRHMDDY